ncbi:MAG: radical SAM protein [Candidatus Pacearchaeota archaeon]
MNKNFVLKNNIVYSLSKLEKFRLENKEELEEFKEDNPLDILKYERKGNRNWLDIQITGKCNLRCAHCYMGEKNPFEIPFSKLKKVFNSSRKLGIYEVILSGGEATLHKDFIKIVNFLNKNRFRIVIVTNGVNFDKFLPYLKNKIYKIIFSLDGFKEDYEKIRGYSFERIVKIIKKTKEEGFNIRINAILHSNLVNYCKKFKDFVKNELDCEVTFLPVADSGYAKNNKWLNADLSVVGNIMKEVGCFSDKSKCEFYYNKLSIDYRGYIYPCQFFREIDSYRLGNILEDDLYNLIKKIDALNLIPKTDGSSCLGCKDLKKCGAGCRGRALAYNCDPNTPDPFWHDIFTGKKTDKEVFPILKNPLYEKIGYTKYPSSKKLTDYYKKIIIGLKPKTLMEIGCGNGNFLLEFSENIPGRCLGIDKSSNMLKNAKKRKNVEFLVGEIKDLKEHFDVSIAIYSLFNHFKSKEEILDFFEKLSKLSDYFIFDVNNYDLFKKESLIKEDYDELSMEEYVRQSTNLIYSLRKYKQNGKEYFYGSSWPKINWDAFLKKYGTFLKINIGSRIIYQLKFYNA